MAIPVLLTPTQMPLSQELASINSQNRVSQIQSGSDKTIDAFWTSFIEPALPDKNAVVKWFELLSDYVDQDDAVFALRCYGNWESYQAKDDYTLRRGFYNLTDKDYSFFYTDNFFAAYFAKMAVDNFVPTLSEFKTMMQSREFPARFGRSTAVERTKAAYSIDGRKGKNPGFTSNGYKIAHIVDSGKRIYSKGLETTMGQVCDKYCDRGDYNDWTLRNDGYGDFYARDLKMDPDAREFFVAHFLRFVCPMNYLFTPKKDCHVLGVKVYMDDIAECDELQQYAMQQFHLRYGKVYEDFLNRIMLPPDLDLKSLPSIATLGTNTIDISYGYRIKSNTGLATKTKVKTNSNNNKTKNVILMPRINSRSILKTLRGMRTLPATVKLTNKANFKDFLDTKTDVSRDAANTYLSSIGCDKINALLRKHSLPQDIYKCEDLYNLVDVLDELVNKKNTDEAKEALENGGGACSPALCYLIVHLLSNMGIVIWP